MDLSNFDLGTKADAGAWLTLRHPSTGEDLPIRIRLVGKDSQIWRQGERSFSDRRLEQAQKAGKLKITTLQIEERGLRLLAAATLEWEGIELDRAPVPCTMEQALRVYERFNWIAEQADEFVADRANFLPTPVEAIKGDSLFVADLLMDAIAKNS